MHEPPASLLGASANAFVTGMSSPRASATKAVWFRTRKPSDRGHAGRLTATRPEGEVAAQGCAGAGRPSFGGRRTARCPRRNTERPSKQFAGFGSVVEQQRVFAREAAIIRRGPGPEPKARPNPSLERTLYGMPPRPPGAVYHVAPGGRGVTPPRSAQLKR